MAARELAALILAAGKGTRLKSRIPKVLHEVGMERAEETPDLQPYQRIAGGLLGVLLLAGVAWAIFATGAEPFPALTASDNVRDVGAALLTDFTIPFELASVVLLVAIIGAVVLAKKGPP